MRLIRILAAIARLRLARYTMRASLCLAKLGQRLYGI
jgi:hypothetical protein